MATQHDRAPEGDDPAADDRANYDYVAGDVERPALVDAISARIDGEVRFDTYTRELYATDASPYEQTPIGVVFPRSTADVAATVAYCSEHDLPVLPRGGGTSLAGQAVNEAVVLDFSRHMDAVLDVDERASTATAQAGVTLGALNDRLAPDGLKFAPDPAAGDRSALGGAIGNDSTGAHSLQYGKTEAYVESCEVVLADGTVETFGTVTLDELRNRAVDGSEGDETDLLGSVYDVVRRIVDEEAATVDSAFPDLKRNVSGYSLDRLVEEAEAALNVDEAPGEEAGTINLARLLAGSEGTLGIVTEATVSLEPIPESKAMALLAYESLGDAMADVAPILEHDPAAVETLDDVLLDLAAVTEEFGDLVTDLVPPDAAAVLLVEFYVDNDPQGKQVVADLLADRTATVSTTGIPREGAEDLTDAPVTAIHGIEAHDEDERKRFWKLRKSGLPILLGRTSDAKHISFIEDAAVPPTELPEFVAGFQEILDEHDTIASFYGHAGPGCLHVRPLIDTKTVEGVERMVSIADAVTDLVIEHDGAVSGEHGDGRARSAWNRKRYGEDVWRLFRDLKTAFDPDWLLNPGQVCGYGADETMPEDTPARARVVSMDEALRFDPEYEFDAGFDPALNWENENGMQGMVELCHGCGGCRGSQETTGGVMCPTYRAADEESTATRGRANALRQAMSGDLPDDPTSDAFASEVLDLCIGCKGCARDCPSDVDMAKLKVEVDHARHQEEGASLRDKLFANVATVNRLGSRLAPISNWATSLPYADVLAEQLFGIARERDLPTFERQSFTMWFVERQENRAAAERSRPNEGATTDCDRRVVLLADPYSNYTETAVPKAAVRVLEAAGVDVTVDPSIRSSGRAAYSKGFIDVARSTASDNVDTLAPLIAEGVDVVCVEPSDAVMLQSDYLDLLDGSAVERVAGASYGVCEYLDRTGLADDLPLDAPECALTYHGHCHQKATRKDHHAVRVLRRAGYAVDPLDSGCCGMAGSFGYEAEHYSMSQAIGDILFEQVEGSSGEEVVAPGASCRTQLGDRPTTSTPAHPIERLADALPGSPQS